MASNTYTVRNTAQGPRGLNAGPDGLQYLELAPGQTLTDVELSDAEHKSAERTGNFQFGAAAKAAAKQDAAAVSGEGLPNNMPKLKGIAKTEGVDLTGKTTVADIQKAILDARAAKAAEQSGAGGATPPTDDLDNMDDSTLLATAAAITGKPVAELDGTDRESLLKLARGQE